VLLIHAALGWFFLSIRAQPSAEIRDDAPPVIVEFIEQATPRNLSFGPVPVHVKTETVVNVPRLQRLAPKIQDIPVEAPEAATTPITLPQPATAPIPDQTKAGLDGEAIASAAESGGGTAITLLQRVIPRYPEAAARRQQAGATQVMLRVDVSGRVSDVKITRSSGSRSLDDAAVQAFRLWKFAPTPEASVPGGLWIKTEQRFIYYRFRYSRLSDKAADRIDVEAVQPAKDQVTPGSADALHRFINDVGAGTLADEGNFAALQKMRDALEEWGPVKSIHFTGRAGPRQWTAYRTRPDAREGITGSSVEVKWNLFEVTHQRATTEWVIAIDRNGTIWAARASPAPWVQTARVN
jgi:TonB family protein